MSASKCSWADTPAVQELREAAAECGLTIDPLAEREADWGLDEVDLLRLHRAWSAKMRERCGFPEAQPDAGYTIPKWERKESEAAKAKRATAIRERWASADTLQNRILGVLDGAPRGAVTPNAVVERLNLPRGVSVTNKVAAALAHAYKRGTVARRVIKNAQGMGKRTGYAYWRVAA